MDINRIRLKDKKLYLIVSSDGFDSEEQFLDAIAASLNGGAKIIQLREKNSSAKKIIELGKRIRSLCSIYDALFIVNDRVDIAKVVEADGVHIGPNDIDIHSAREILGETAMVGISAYNTQQVLEAQKLGADYLLLDASMDNIKCAVDSLDTSFFMSERKNAVNIDCVLNSGVKKIALTDGILNSLNPEKAVKLALEKLK